MHKELDHYRQALQRYITSTYHISDPKLVDLRDQLLDAPGSIAQEPYIESTPRYDKPGSRCFEDLAVPAEVKQLLSHLGSSAGGNRVFDPPYEHQAQATEAIFEAEPPDLVVTTGTGSGKTETFLLPILARLAREAASSPARFQQRAIRAITLYPMNALVNDQLGRLRNLFGSPEVATWFSEQSDGGRPLKFARYTGKALYPGTRAADTKVHSKKLLSLRFYVDLETRAAQGDTKASELIAGLRSRGKWPSKPSTDPGAENGMSDWLGSGRWKTPDGQWRRSIERPGDPELLIRQECHEAPPDLLVTNYSMLEYMLLRPVERGLFQVTRDYFHANPEERLILVLDEAHLYRGAQGTEVAMLIRRLFHRLGLHPDRVQVICTSASFSDPTLASTFAAGLSGKSCDSFRVLAGDKVAHSPSGPGDSNFVDAILEVDAKVLRIGTVAQRVAHLLPFLAALRPILRCHKYNVTCPDISDDVEVLVRGLAADRSEITEAVVVTPGHPSTTQSLMAMVTAVESANGVVIDVSPATSTGHASSTTPEVRFSAGKEIIGINQDPIARLLFDALHNMPATGRLINLTSGAVSSEDSERDEPGVGPAQSIQLLGQRLFPTISEEKARQASDVLVELCCIARQTPSGPPLLAARAHAFFRGLPGLWACSNPNCTEILHERQGGPTGKLFSQPTRVCACGAKVFQLYTCRDCGTAFFKTFSDQPSDPKYLWPEDVGDVDDDTDSTEAVYLCLREPLVGSDAIPVDLELLTGRLHTAPGSSVDHLRDVWLPAPGTSGNDGDGEGLGKFARCPCCEAQGDQNGRNYPIQDHVTKGDQPFQTLVAAQLLTQPPRPDVQTPLQGRKTLIFSDGRQLASRLAGTLKQMSLRDSVRPLLLDGISLLSDRFERAIPLNHTYIALLVSCVHRGVHLRPTEAPLFDEDLDKIRRFWQGGVDSFEEMLAISSQLNHQSTNRALMGAVYPVLNDAHTGLSALAIATIAPVLTPTESDELVTLPVPDGIDGDDDAQKRSRFLELWLTLAYNARCVYLPTTPAEWIDSDQPGTARIVRTKGVFGTQLRACVGARWHKANMTAPGNGSARPWLDFLRRTFGTHMNSNGMLLGADKLQLVAPAAWVRCKRCTAVQPELPQTAGGCIVRWGRRHCAGEVAALVPDTDSVFQSRKGFYRNVTRRMQQGSDTTMAPHPFIAEEHSAALGDTAGSSRAIGWAEWHELRFQDLDVEGPEGKCAGPIDVLSCTTTMEVGIDIGSLTAVALRNVPPGRANYQQRAGRAGRRGSALATVITYCDSDSHDQRFFREPAAMVSGPVGDPSLNLDNEDIIRRHLFALILSSYQQDAIGSPESGGSAPASVFESLGLLDTFREGAADQFSFAGLASWIDSHRKAVIDDLRELVPIELENSVSIDRWVEGVPDDLLRQLESVGAGPIDAVAIVEELEPTAAEDERADGLTVLQLQHSDDPIDLDDFDATVDGETNAPPDDTRSETQAIDLDLESDARRLLNRLFDSGILPRYAFPTDVVNFNVFSDDSGRWRPELRFTPSLGLNQALSAYAPGREVWVNGVRHYSLGIWSPFWRDRLIAFRRHRLYSECVNCGYGQLDERHGTIAADTSMNCPACGASGALGPASRWFRPPGFSHPPDVATQLAMVDQPRATRATRAKLSGVFAGSDDPQDRHDAPGGSGYQVWSARQKLLVTNSGNADPQHAGFRYCTKCGRAEPNGWGESVFHSPNHARPYPNYGRQEPLCNGRTQRVVLGNEFLTDIALFRFRLGDGISLPPGSVVSQIVLVTLANALSSAAAAMLDVESSDICGEYRVALTPSGSNGREVDVFLYDLAAGGAGFVRAAAANPSQLIDHAYRLLTSCSCQHSCYNCLRSYQNKWDHALLDRTLASSLLEHCRTGTTPEIPTAEEDRLLATMAVELRDAGQEAVVEEGSLRLPGLDDRRIVLGHPLAPERPGSARARQWDQAIVVSQLTADRAMATAVQRAISAQSGQQSDWALPAFLVECEGGCPVFRVSDFAANPMDAVPKAHVNILGAPDNAFVTQLETESMKEKELGNARQRPFDRQAWVVWEPTTSDDFDHRTIQLVRSLGGAFGATGACWTVGSPRLRTNAEQPTVKLNYTSRNQRCRSQAIPANEAESLGRLWGVYRYGTLLRIS